MFREVLFERVWRAQALRFLRAEQGASTIEFVIWVPVFALLLGLVADAALIYGGQARILRVVQDGNRAMSIGRVTDTNTLESQLDLERDYQRMAGRSDDYREGVSAFLAKRQPQFSGK